MSTDRTRRTVGRVHVSRDLLEPSSTVDNVDPHGIPRPTRADLARAFLVRVADLLDDELHAGDLDADALSILADALDALETLEDPRCWDVSTALENRRAAIAAGAYGTTLDAGPRRVEWHPIATRSRIVDGLDRLETEPEHSPESTGGRWFGRMHVSADLVPAMLEPEPEHVDTTRADLEHAAQAATRRALEAPAPILAAFLEDGTYSVGQLAAVLDVRGWTAADLDRLEACADRDRLTIALEIHGARA